MRPMMRVRDFGLLIILNTVIAVIYLVYGLLRYRAKRGTGEEMRVGSPESVVI